MVRLNIETPKHELTVTKSAGAVIHRITPLGFTDQEAIGWYRNNLQNDWSLRFVIAILSGFALVLVDVFENAYLQSSLMIDMILQHFVRVMVGMLFAYAAYCTVSSGVSVRLSKVCEWVMKRTSLINRHGIVSFAAASLIILYWTLPSSFDAARSSHVTQVAMTLSFSCVGALVLAGSMRISPNALIMFSIAVGKMMGLLGAFLILSPTYLYHVYPASQQAETGVILIAIMTVIDMTVLPCWLYRYFRTNIRQS